MVSVRGHDVTFIALHEKLGSCRLEVLRKDIVKIKNTMKRWNTYKFCELISYLLQIYGINNVTAKTDASILSLTQPWSMMPIDYVEPFGTRHCTAIWLTMDTSL